MAALEIITGLTVILLAGLLVSLLSKRFRVPNVLFLMILGFLLAKITIAGVPLFNFDHDLLVGMSIFSLAIIVFYGSSTFEFKAVDSNSSAVLRVVSTFLITNVIVITLLTNWLMFPFLSITSILLSLIFSSLMSATDAATVLSIFKDKTNKVLDFLKLEAIFNTPLTVLIPFIVLDFLTTINLHSESVNTFSSAISPFLLNILVGIGAGVLVSLVMLRALRKFYHASLSPVIMITSALLAYVLAENLLGNGVISVATLGMFFGNFAVKHKESLQEFNLQLTGILEILVFVMVGLVININLSGVFLLKALLLFIVIMLIRWFTFRVSLPKEEFSKRERTFMIMNMPKGLAVAVVILTLGVSFSNGNTLANTVIHDGIQLMLDLSVIVMMYSLIISSLLSIFSKRFIRIKLE